MAHVLADLAEFLSFCPYFGRFLASFGRKSSGIMARMMARVAHIMARMARIMAGFWRDYGAIMARYGAIWRDMARLCFSISVLAWWYSLELLKLPVKKIYIIISKLISNFFYRHSAVTQQIACQRHLFQ